MNMLCIGALAVATGGAFCGGAVAQVSRVDRETIVHVAPRTQFVSTYQYKAAKHRIAAEFKSAKAGCDDLSAHARGACVAEARVREKAATAELEARHKRTLEAYREARLLGTESQLALAGRRCHGLTQAVRNRCLNEVQASFGMI